MKKETANRLKVIAGRLPVVFNEQTELVPFTVRELKLTPYFENTRRMVVGASDDHVVNVPMPKFVAVEHEQQLKDAYKRGGDHEVEEYVRNVLRQAKEILLNGHEDRVFSR